MTQGLEPYSRRGLLGVAGAAALAACHKPAAPKPAGGAPVAAMTLEAAVGGGWRSAADRSFDRWRHPLETLRFWGLKPGMTVVEFWPGEGWCTDILAPYLHATGGTLYAANIQPATPAARLVVEAYGRKLAARPGLYGPVRQTAFGATSGPAAPARSCDLALFLCDLADWMRGGIAEKAFRDAFDALKPGGILGVEQHRAAPGGVQDVLATNGYVQEAYVRQMAKEAGFAFEAASELNANPKDRRDYPFGVRTLPPSRLSAPEGQPPDPRFDHRPYDAIGASDRMTLRLRKPA